MIAAVKPTNNAVRAPYMQRVRMSRPNGSVPNQNSALGGASIDSKEASSGS